MKRLRATVAAAVPNFVCGMTVPITILFQLARKQLGLAIALFSLSRLGGNQRTTAPISWRMESSFSAARYVLIPARISSVALGLTKLAVPT